MKMGAHNSTLFFFTFNLQNTHVHCRKKNISEVWPVALQERQLSPVGCVSPGHFSPLVLKLPTPTFQSISAMAAHLTLKGGCSPHSPPCFPITLLSTRPPLPATCLTSQHSFLKLWGSGWHPDHSPRSAACRAVPRRDICLPLCGCLTVLLPRSQTTLSYSLTQLS